jgi:hypothetical protein
MKKGFCNIVLGVILLGSFATASLAEPILTSVEQMKKKKAQIVVVNKKDRNKAESGSQDQRLKPEKRN